MTPDDILLLIERLVAADRLRRLRLAHLPTPLEPLPALSAEVGGVRLWIKRDDCTGLAFGGNKTRHNEFVFGEAMRRGVRGVVWGASVQSNNCRQTAATCARLGLPLHLVLTTAHGETTDTALYAAAQGNLLLDHLLGATVEFVDVPLGPRFRQLLWDVAREAEFHGGPVFCAADPVVEELAAVSYIVAAAELFKQLWVRCVRPKAIYVSSSGATGAGLAAGLRLMGWTGRLRIIAPIEWPWPMDRHIADLANRAAFRIGEEPGLRAEDVDVDVNYIGPAYGMASEEGLQALELLARKEAILLDPIYSAKAFAALLDDVRKGVYAPQEDVLFIHTGGTPALFAHSPLLTRRLARYGRPWQSVRTDLAQGEGDTAVVG